MSEISIGALIENELHRQERTTVWFARKLGCNRQRLQNFPPGEHRHGITP